MTPDFPSNFLLYDGDCPFCNRYMQKVRLERALAHFVMMNARDAPALVKALRGVGLDINAGMILSVDGKLFHGAECMQRLALMSTRSSWFNKLTASIFSRPRAARILYPLLVTGRNASLYLLGRGPIDPSDDTPRGS
ncbi:DUF393 domain-containing protein [Massilia aurea]|jgi:predicted DCC family thiol-disulfide oxidoreductase YuxK|uniref:DUF393 domain-containing protein n=1 Tax=Massilia aurea TaxID=373040 RepID=UPI0021617FEE|nr:DUF393 domain-containing protein [Massilia aurea]MCS0707337.1 DUF393 domain-containing protein [Massilia aurea]